MKKTTSTPETETPDTTTETNPPTLPDTESKTEEEPKTWTQIKQTLQDLASRLSSLEVTSENQAPVVSIPIPPKPLAKDEETADETPTEDQAQETPKHKTLLDLFW